VEATGVCLVTQTFGADAAGARPTLVVAIHGDGSDGGPSDYMASFVRGLARPGVVGVVLVRPGYATADGRISGGSTNGRRDNYTAGNVAAVGAAIGALRARHRAGRVVVVGHSGGAAIAGVLIGQRPGLIQGAVLAACPCDVPRWRTTRSGPWPRSLSPHSFAGGVSRATRVVAITGASDTNTTPDLAEAYVRALAARGVPARFVSTGAGHGFGGLAAAAATAASGMIR
jgi:predicted esterase